MTTAPALLCFDGSPQAAAGIEAVLGLLAPRDLVVATAWQPAGATDLVGVSDMPPTGGDAAREVDRMREQRAADVAAQGASLAAAWPGAVTWRTVSGPGAAAALAALARELQAAVVVTGGRDAAARHPWLHGSVSRSVAHHAGRPVLIAHAVAGEGERAGPVLLCFDGSDQARAAIAAAGGLLNGGPAVVIHAFLAPSHVLLWNPLLKGPGPLAGPAALLDESSREGAERLAAEGAELARAAGFDATASTVPIERGLWRTLLRVAGEHRARVIVAGTRGWSTADLALGTVADRLAVRADRPVLLAGAAE